MVEGLKVPIKGAALKTALTKKVEQLQELAHKTQADADAKQDDRSDENRWIPATVLENEVDRLEVEITALNVFRDHIVDAEDYLLGRADLEFANLIPKPDPVVDPIVCYKR